ncbi:hypothetical protein [Niallia taxi]|uniref:Uncharacterized protein n=2 Tax=Bacillati TaxID=1783272 RepID=A0A3S2U6U2_9BACI|nr:hypothetical protein [Niallia taxi]RVT57204.1 hypothetical protein EM808_25010 [Niallia taxi]
MWVSRKELLLWSIALPGFGQLLNGKLFKGIGIIILEILINVNSHFNEVIMLSFQGDIEKATLQADYQWLMFYPCLYFFSMWDAWIDGGGRNNKYSFLPLVFVVYFVTIGCIYSSKFRLFGILFGPVWLPILAVIPGLVIGILIKNLLIIFVSRKSRL